MKKLKKISLFNFFLFILTIFTFFYTKNYIKQLKYSSKYNIYDNEIKGYIKDKKIDDNKIIYYIDDLILYDYKINKEYEIGDYVLINGKISIPGKNTLPNLFNYQLYLYSLNIHYIVNIDSINKIEKRKPIVLFIKGKIKNYLYKYKNKEYMLAFILGDNSLIKEDIKESYSINGISHLFAISGMHVAIISGILLFLLNKITSKRNTLVIIYLFFLFYLFLNFFSKSIVRASFLFFLVTLKKYLKLKISIVKLFYLFALMMIIINPYNILNISFQFSYIVTFFLMMYKDIINRNKNYFVKLFFTSLISFLCSLPIVINNFYQINLLSVFLNLIFVPFISLLIFPLSLIVFVIKPLEFIFSFFINLLENISLILSKYEIIIVLSHINIPYFIMYYVIITFILYKCKHKKYYYFIIIIFIIFIHTNINYFIEEKNITFINVKQGDSILIQINSNTILIDTGGIKNYKISKNLTIPYLKSLGVKKISYLILTHGDYDHMGEAINLVNNFKVDKVIFNCGPYNDLEKELIKVLDKNKIPYYSCIKELNIDNNKLYFLQTKEYDNENDNSNVIYTEIDGYKFMFMGDAGVDKEKDILDKYNISDVDVLKVGHHGSKTSSSEEFINEMKPVYSIISVGKNNRYGHPNKEVLNVLDNSKIYRTDEVGSIMFKIKNNKLKIETCTP